MKREVIIYISAVIFLIANFSNAAITKGPYLINPTQTSMTIMWECDSAEVSVIMYGPNSELEITLRPTISADCLWFSYDYGPAHFVSLDYRGENDPEMMD